VLCGWQRGVLDARFQSPEECNQLEVLQWYEDEVQSLNQYCRVVFVSLTDVALLTGGRYA
jgi:hypothetical protein